MKDNNLRQHIRKVMDNTNKISEMFEGENSSLRKTYDEATKTEQIREEFIEKYQFSFNISSKELGVLADWWLQKLAEQRESFELEVKKIKNRFKCGACDGAKCEHTQCCQALSSSIASLQEIIKLN